MPLPMCCRHCEQLQASEVIRKAEEVPKCSSEMVQDWKKTLYDSVRPNCSSLFLMLKGRLEDDLIAAYHHLHGEKVLSCLNSAGKSRVQAHCLKLEPAETRHKTLAHMMVHWNSHFQRMCSGRTDPFEFSNPELCVWLAPGPWAQYRRALAALGGLELRNL